MTRVRRFRYGPLLAAVLLVLVLCLVLPTSQAHAASNVTIPWLDDIVAGLKASLVKILQDLDANDWDYRSPAVK